MRTKKSKDLLANIFMQIIPAHSGLKKRNTCCPTGLLTPINLTTSIFDNFLTSMFLKRYYLTNASPPTNQNHSHNKLQQGKDEKKQLTKSRKESIPQIA